MKHSCAVKPAGVEIHGEDYVPGTPIKPATRVATVLAAHSELRRVFVQAGFAGLADPNHQPPDWITIEFAAQRHGANLPVLLEALNHAVQSMHTKGPTMTRPTQNKGLLPAAEAADITGLVAYQAGSIVSREILKKATGTLTVFAFDAGQGLSEHTAPFDALVQVLDGEAEITIAGRPHRVQAGQMILMPAHQPHALQAKRPFKMLLTMIRQ